MNSEDICRCMKLLVCFVTLFTCFCTNAQQSAMITAQYNNMPVAKSVNGDTTKYAVLYVYTTGGFDERTQLFVDSMAVCGLPLRAMTITRLYKEGVTQLSVQEGLSWKPFLHNVNAENRHKIISKTLNVEFGKQYVLECHLFGPHQPITFNFDPKLSLYDPADLKPYSYNYTNSPPQGIAAFPELKQPVSFCEHIQRAWNELYLDHPEIKEKFDSLPSLRPYYLDLRFTIDTLGKLIVDDPGKLPATSASPEHDLICLKALQNVLQKTQWVPSQKEKGNNNEKKLNRYRAWPVETKGYAVFTITSKGFQAVEMVYDSKFFERFYECNIGK